MTIQKRLLEWYDLEGRTLPWRGTTDPYPILVSEIMLQQTQVKHVLNYFDKWLKRFPSWVELAEATDGEVLEYWSGLGYNRRALALKNIAVQIIERSENPNHPAVPESYEEWISLKGIGPYTGSALSIFTLNIKKLPIDTNIRRVLGRVYLGIHYPQLSDDTQIDLEAQSILETDRFSDIPQAIFDLANIHCLKNPICETCPLRDHCAAAPDFLAGNVEPPKRMTPKPKERVHKNKKHPDRIYRGRILKYIREHQPVQASEGSSYLTADLKALATSIDPTFDGRSDTKWLRSMLERLTDDGLIKLQGSTYIV